MSSTDQTKAGILFAVCAYSIWGVAPIYFKALMHIPAEEILMHRVIWSVAVLCILILVLKQVHKVKTALTSSRVVITLLFAGILLAGNWLLFIWSINNNYLLEASLGYFINPLINVFLGRLFLGETLRPIQKFAVALAMLGVGLLLFSYGQLPWIALCLATSFSVYGLLRKQVQVDSMPGLFIETSMMLPAAALYWILFAGPNANLISNTASFNLLLIFAGIITTAPLLCFTAAARRIKYSTLGMLQYIGPSIMFALAVLVYGEPLSTARFFTFAIVWTALAIFSYDLVYHYRKSKRLNKPI